MKKVEIRTKAMERRARADFPVHILRAVRLRSFSFTILFAVSLPGMGMLFSCRSAQVEPEPHRPPALQGSFAEGAPGSVQESASEEDRRRQEAEAKAEEDRRRQEAEAKAEEDRRRREAEAKAEEDRRRREAEAEAKAEEDRRRQEAEAKAEEDRRRQEAEEDRRRREAEAKAEEDRRRQEAEYRRLASSARERALSEKTEYERALALYTQEEQKKVREERLDREDPDRHAFYRTALQNRLGRDLTVIVPEKSNLYIFGNPAPVQFQGYGSFRHSYDPRLLSARPVDRKASEITDLVLKNGGNYILLYFKGNAPSPYTPDLKEMMRDGYDLPGFLLNGKWYYIINLYSDGADLIRVEAEEKESGKGIPEYLIWSVDHLFVSHQDR